MAAARCQPGDSHVSTSESSTEQRAEQAIAACLTNLVVLCAQNVASGAIESKHAAFVLRCYKVVLSSF